MFSLLKVEPGVLFLSCSSGSFVVVKIRLFQDEIFVFSFFLNSCKQWVFFKLIPGQYKAHWILKESIMKLYILSFHKFYYKIDCCWQKTTKTRLIIIIQISWTLTIWQYGLWRFQTGDTKLERFKKCQNLTFKVNFLCQKSSESFSIFFHWRIPI